MNFKNIYIRYSFLTLLFKYYNLFIFWWFGSPIFFYSCTCWFFSFFFFGCFYLLLFKPFLFCLFGIKNFSFEVIISRWFIILFLILLFYDIPILSSWFRSIPILWNANNFFSCFSSCHWRKSNIWYYWICLFLNIF